VARDSRNVNERFPIADSLLESNRSTSQKMSQKILLIDDDETSRYAVKQLLVNVPMEILEAKSGLILAM
jgi:PleD family two-component response regulator